MFELLVELFVVLLLLDFFCLLLLEDVDVVSETEAARGSTGRFEDRDDWCDASASFSGDEGESLELVSCVIGL